MGLLKWLFGSKPAVQDFPVENEKNKPEIREEDFIDNTDPNEEQSDNVYQVAYGTGFAIDAIYGFVKRDFEQKGFEDAMVNPENSYKESGMLLVKNELKQLFEQVRLKYRGDLRLLQVQIDNLEKQGLPYQAANLYARKETYEEHMKKIDDMEQKLENEEASMMTPIYTYERGFLKGLSAKSDIILNGHGERH